MTMTIGYFYCKVCDIKFKGEYETQQRPRRSCPTCHKSCDLTKKTKSKEKPISPQRGDTSHIPLTTKLSADYLEKCLTEALAINPNNPNLLRTAIEFFIKIKGKTDKLDDDLDMEVLKAIGVKITASD